MVSTLDQPKARVICLPLISLIPRLTGSLPDPFFREHGDGSKPLDEFTKKLAKLDRPVDLYSDEACTNPIPDVGEDYVPTVIDESCSFTIDLSGFPAQKNDAESAVDFGLASLPNTAT